MHTNTSDIPPLPMMDANEWQRMPDGEWRTLVRALCSAAVTGVPVALNGPPGTGKSTAVRSFAAAYGRAIQEPFFFEVVLNPGTSPSQIAGGIDLQTLVSAGKVEITPRGSAADPSYKVVFIDELGRGGLPAIAALLRHTETPGGRLVVGASNFDFNEVRRMRSSQDGSATLFDAIAQRFARVSVPRSLPRLDPKGIMRDAMEVAIDIVGETACVWGGETSDIRRARVFPLDRLGIPTYDETVAFGEGFREKQSKGAVTISQAIHDAIDALGSVMGSGSARVMTRIAQALITQSAFERWRLVDPELWSLSYRNMQWGEYQRVCAQSDAWTRITSISPSTAEFIAAIAASSHGDSVVGSVMQCFNDSIRVPTHAPSPHANSGSRGGKRSRP